MARDGKMRRRNKFHAIRTDVDGIVFDSKLEAKRYRELLILQAAGEICLLSLQVPYVLILNNSLICKYIVDFEYRMGEKLIAEDVKGMLLPATAIKIKLAKALYPKVEFTLWPERKKKRRGSKKK
jgi:hypothetical protein